MSTFPINRNYIFITIQIEVENVQMSKMWGGMPDFVKPSWGKQETQTPGDAPLERGAAPPGSLHLSAFSPNCQFSTPHHSGALGFKVNQMMLFFCPKLADAPLSAHPYKPPCLGSLLQPCFILSPCHPCRDPKGVPGP